MIRFFGRAWNWFWATNNILNYPLGLLIELRGNTIAFDRVRLSLDNTGIPTKRKFRLMFDYEYAERRLIKRYLNRDLPVIELGGFVGGVACVTNKLLRHPTQHIVVEASPTMQKQLEKNRLLNRAQFSIVPAAIAYNVSQVAVIEEGMTSTVVDESSSSTWTNTISVGQIINSCNYSRINLICDIEGNELNLIAHEAEILCQYVVWLILEVHPSIYGDEAVQSLLERLQSIGFAIVDQVEMVYALKNGLPS